MPVGVIVDALAVVIGGIVGAVVGKKLKKDFIDNMNLILGCCSMCMGVSTIVLMQHMPAVVFAIILGTGLGLSVHLGKLINNYTKEAGVRSLERSIGRICRKTARAIMEEGKDKVVVTSRNISRFLGKERYNYLMANEKDEIGIARGLAWTQVGGDTLQIEVNIMPGKGELLLTGQLGDVMKESAQAGISYIRSVSDQYEIDPEFFQKHDMHVHIPEGAVPKDGPSAGITMATAMLSAIIEKPVRADLAMTGEITLRGRVLPIGGLKEKLLAAKYARIKEVLVPEKNRPDIEEMDREIIQGLNIRFVDSMKEVLGEALA